MKVCMVSSYPPQQCGIGKFSYHLREGILSCNKMDVEVISIVDNYRSDFGPEVAYQIKSNNPEDLTKAADYINSNPYDVIILHHEFSFFSGAWGSDVTGFLRSIQKKVVTVIHSPLDNMSGFGRNILEEVGKLSSAIIALSETAKRTLISSYNMKEDKIVVIPNGIPVHSTQSKESLKEKLNFNNKVVCVSFGYLSYHKGYDLVLQVLPEIVLHYPNILYLIIGVTHPLFREGEEYLSTLKGMVQSLGLEKNVQFISKYLSDEELIQYIIASDLFISPYRSDQKSSYTLSHAAFYGKACISTSFYGAAEMLGDGSGILIPFEDKERLCDSLKMMLANPEKIEELGKTISKKTENLGWPTVAEAYIKLTESLILA